MGHATAGMTTEPISQKRLLEAYQHEDQMLYAAITRELAIKVGVSVNIASRKNGIKFGGVERFIAFHPGGYPEERKVHASLAEFRIPGTREYYYPDPGILPVINTMREWMGIRPLRRRDLPRPARCTFHARVLNAEASGVSVFK